MVLINIAQREISCKIVYYGPGLCGKTTNIQVVHDRVPAENKGKLTSLATEGDRTLYFDFLPIDLGTISGMRTKFQLYTVPGQVFYNATRKLVLRGADGIVFVADSNADKMQENVESLDNLIVNLKEHGVEITDVPLVFQWNKRDLPNAVPTEDLQKSLNRWNVPAFPAIAIKGEGVFATLKCVSQLVLENLSRKGQRLRPPAAPGPPEPKPQPMAAAEPPHPVGVGTAVAGAAVAPPRPSVPPPRPAPPPPSRPVPSPQPVAAASRPAAPASPGVGVRPAPSAAPAPSRTAPGRPTPPSPAGPRVSPPGPAARPMIQTAPASPRLGPLRAAGGRVTSFGSLPSPGKPDNTMNWVFIAVVAALIGAILLLLLL